MQPCSHAAMQPCRQTRRRPRPSIRHCHGTRPAKRGAVRLATPASQGRRHAHRISLHNPVPAPQLAGPVHTTKPLVINNCRPPHHHGLTTQHAHTGAWQLCTAFLTSCDGRRECLHAACLVHGPVDASVALVRTVALGRCNVTGPAQPMPHSQIHTYTTHLH